MLILRIELFDPDGHYSFHNIHVGNDVSLGARPVLMAALSKIHIGDHVMFGPEAVIIGGGHNITVADRFMTEVHEKRAMKALESQLRMMYGSALVP